MELAICLGVMIAVMELSEYRSSKANKEKFDEMSIQLRRIRMSQSSFDKGVSMVFDLIKKLEEKQPDLKAVEEITTTLADIKQQNAMILKESETIAKYRSQPVEYDIIEGAV